MHQSFFLESQPEGAVGLEVSKVYAEPLHSSKYQTHFDFGTPEATRPRAEEGAGNQSLHRGIDSLSDSRDA